MDIVEELRRDRESGARRLEAEYKVGLLALARRFCTDPGDAEELVNATFAEVIDNIDDYIEQSAFFAWMCQILTSKFSRSVRRKSRQMEVYPGDVPEMEDEGAREEIYANLDASLLRDAIAKLPQEQREIIVLRYFTDMPVAKIAKFLSIPSGTARSRLHYARLALAAKIGPAAKKGGAKALVLALALCGVAALGAAVWSLASGGDASTDRPQDDAEAAISGKWPDQDEAAISGKWPYQDADPSGSAGNSQLSNSQLSNFQLSTPQEDAMKNSTTSIAAAMMAATALAASPAAQAVETIAYWPFGNSGFADASGNGGPALTSTTVSNDGAAYVTLDGSSQFLQTATALDLSGEEKITIECWTRLTGANKDFGILFSSAKPHAAAGGIVCYYNKSASKLQAQYRVALSDPNTPWQLDATNSIAIDGMWHHVAYTIDRTRNGNSATLLYIDGVKASESTGKTGTMPALFNDIFYIGGGAGYVSG
ncbi:MAG: sigma-70 family RNA polymerase sigma factor, partial [Kiritimatiellae bacterium]|nr:sigma-70 family RNA polymerase sigma factor [Kiritimatiellia bacterium]